MIKQLWKYCFLALLVLPLSIQCSKTETPGASGLKLSITFNNIPFNETLETSWGFSCVIEGLKKTILFDTGGSGDILLANMEKMGIDPKQIDIVALSHYHGDHTNGLRKFLEQNPKVTVYMPQSFPDTFQLAVEKTGAQVKTVTGPCILIEGLHSTGEMGQEIIEQSLVLETAKGPVVITGCAHPGIDNIVDKSRRILEKDAYLVLGGFHLGQTPEAEIQQIIGNFKNMGVEKVAPTHCTGDKAIEMFRQAWGDMSVEAGCGAVIEL